MRPPILILTLLGALAVAPHATAQPKTVITRHGARYTGQVETQGKLTIVRSARRHIYLSSALVARTEPAAKPAELPVYRVNRAIMDQAKKSPEKVSSVMEITYGQWTAQGTIPVTMKDPSKPNKRYETVLVISQLTPETYRLEARDYQWQTDVAVGTLGLHWVTRLLGGQITAPDAASQLKAARFFRLMGHPQRARQHLDRLAQAEPQHAALPTERVALEASLLTRALGQAEALAIQQRYAEAQAKLSPLSPSVVVADAAPQAAARLTALKAQLTATLARVKRATAYLEARNQPPARPLTDAQATRLLTLIGLTDDGKPKHPLPPAIDARALLLPAWAAQLTPAQLADPNQLELAIELAQQAAEFFAHTDSDAPSVPLKALAKALRLAKLPTPLKLAIARHAATFPDVPAAQRAWRKVEWTHPKHKKTPFHYFVAVPSSYRPDRPTPVLVTLHGQLSTADDQRQRWQQLAERYGMILIAPEYIYGRRWGYRSSAEEHRAIAGAVAHAIRRERLHIDRDRVFLQGHSQGGHTSWDLGHSQSGVWAGVLPFIGRPYQPYMTNGYRNTAVFTVTGDGDYSHPKAIREAMPLLARFGADATYVEYVKRGHEGFDEEAEACMRWMTPRARTRSPQEVTACGRRRSDTGARWLELDTTVLSDRLKARTSCDLHARYHPKPNRIELSSKQLPHHPGVIPNQLSKGAVLIDPQLVDLTKPLEIKLDGKRISKKPVRIDWTFALRHSYERTDRLDLWVARVPLRVKRKRR